MPTLLESQLASLVQQYGISHVRERLAELDHATCDGFTTDGWEYRRAVALLNRAADMLGHDDQSLELTYEIRDYLKTLEVPK